MNKQDAPILRNIVRGGALLLCFSFFTFPLVQCSQDSHLNASGWELATGTGDLFDTASCGYPLVSLLIIVPVILLILAFANKPFLELRNVAIAGLVTKVVFIIATYAERNSNDFRGDFGLTASSWLVLAMHIGLCLLAHCSISYDYAENAPGSNKKCRQCEKHSGPASCPYYDSALHENTNQGVSNGDTSHKEALGLPASDAEDI